MVDENLTFEDLLTICRTCLTQCDASSLLTIEEVHFLPANAKLLEVLMKYTDFEDNENYPQKICHDCIVKAESAYNFFEKCNESNSLLNQIVDSLIAAESKEAEEIIDSEDPEFEVITIKNEDIEDVEIKIIFDENEKMPVKSETEEYEDNSESNLLEYEINDASSMGKCKFCGAKLQPDEVEEHNTSFGHFDGSTSFLCPYCDVATSFKNITSFKKHIRTHSCKEWKKHTCEICGKVFKWRKNFSEHLETHTVKEESFMCPECGILLSSMPALQVHRVKEHLQVAGETWGCRYCEMKFTQVAEFKKHLKEVHAEKDFHCIICGKDCEDKRTLYYHEQLHLEEYGIECSYCHKKLLTEEKLILHQRIHKYVKKKHVCHICSKGFKQMDKLEAHIRVHTGEKPFVCSFCSKAFNHQNNLSHHLRLHTGDTPYKCLFCSLEFSNSHSLRKHMSKHAVDTNDEYILND